MGDAMSHHERGFTMTEVLIASVIVSVVTVGGLMARVSASQIMRSQRSTSFAEASGYAQQTAERFHNSIACGEGNPAEWFDAVTCTHNLGNIPGA